jgi:hypothetical protein
MDNILPHGKIIYRGEKIFFLRRKLFIQERQYLASKEFFSPGDPF